MFFKLISDLKKVVLKKKIIFNMQINGLTFFLYNLQIKQLHKTCNFHQNKSKQ